MNDGKDPCETCANRLSWCGDEYVYNCPDYEENSDLNDEEL